jgi:LCP family protein required for cell wall assembly
VVDSSWFAFLRRFAIACVAVTVITVTGIYAGDSSARRTFASSRKLDIPDLEPLKPGQPANYLLIGSDVRTGDSPGDVQAFGSPAETTGQRSDVMMILHVDPKRREGMLVSFPRDLVVKMPDTGELGLLNSAFNAANPGEGPARVIRTLEENFPPLEIHHYLEVDFAGFREIVDAIGRISLYFPTPVHDEWTGLHVETAGCKKVDGVEALAYARSRHYSIPRDLASPAPWRPSGPDKTSPGWIEDPRSDLDRIPRQQYFLRTVSQAAIDKTARNPTRLVGLLDATKANFARDSRLEYDELRRLIYTFKDLDPRRVRMETLPVVQGTGRFRSNLVAADAANDLIRALMLFDDGGPPPAELLPPAEVSVKIVNGTSIPGFEQKAAQQFTAAGFDVTVEAGAADRQTYTSTQVRYAPGMSAEGFTVAMAIQTLNFIEASSRENTLDSDVLLIIGTDYDRLEHRFPGAPSTTAPATTSSPPPTAAPSTTTTTAMPATTVDTRFVPVDPETGGPLVGCPS